ncbi:MAG: SPOR domain-containing protein [Bacteroidota bacterium]|nr:SPOR domain-containing protein [Bacteroidota bacterium]
MKENNDDFGLLDIDSNKYKIKKKFNFFFLLIILFLYTGIFYYIKNNTHLFENKDLVSKIDSIRTEQKNIDSTIIEFEFDSIIIAKNSDSIIVQNKDTIEIISNNTIEIESLQILTQNKLTGKYYIIAGSFSNYKLSLNKANMLLNLGYQPIIILPNRDNMHRVGIDLFDDIDAAKKSLKNYSKKLNDKLWILKY